MQFDRTHIVIRRRSMAELADLSLVLVRHYPSALIVGLSLGAIPWAVANALVLGWIPLAESEFGMIDDGAQRELIRYLAWMGLLVFSQAPAAGTWTTYFLGQAVFEARPTWSSVRQAINRTIFKWGWYLGVVRFPIPLLALMVYRFGQPFDATYDFLLFFVAFGWLVIVRSFRPFLPEILLLEQCPIRATKPGESSISRRNRLLHRPLAGELAVRMMSVGFLSFLSIAAVYFSVAFVRGVILGNWSTDQWSYLVWYPFSLWLVAGITVVFRLLNYLDARIRLGGWEVELAIRAEAFRQFGVDPADATEPEIVSSPIAPETQVVGEVVA